MTLAALVADTDEGFAQAVGAVLERQELRVHATRALDASVLEGDWRLIVVNHDTLSPEGHRVLRALLDDDARRKRVLLHTATVDRGALAALFGDARLLNLLGRGSTLDPLDLETTVRKILHGGIFGAEKYFAPGPSLRTLDLSLTRSADRHAAFQRVTAFAEEAGVGARFLERLEIVTDELITNALYNAPVDEHGRARFAHFSRREDFELAPHEAIVVRVLVDEARVGISVRDPFGSLGTDTVLAYLAKCLRAGADQIDDKAGGAGLGLFTCFEALSHFVINLARGRATEMIGLIHLSASFREFARRSKSLNVFVEDRA
jgi:hypothetical protein